MSDGNIGAAKTKLERAIAKLIDPHMTMHRGRTLKAPSLYEQLVSDLAGTQGDNKSPAKSLPPVWIDAVQLRKDIDSQGHKWWPKPGTTITRLHAMRLASFRPQDTDMVTDMTKTIDVWCDRISNLLDPRAHKFISAPCPECSRQTVYRRDPAGEVVRQPALRIDSITGAICQHCKTVWPPEQFLFLCRLLGFDLPEGVSGDEVPATG